MQLFMMNPSLAIAVITIFFSVWVCSAIPKRHLGELENSEGKLINNNLFCMNMK